MGGVNPWRIVHFCNLKDLAPLRQSMPGCDRQRDPQAPWPSALLLRGGTIMDSTLIAASPSTKNEARKRDPDMSQSKKGNQWYFGPPLMVCK